MEDVIPLRPRPSPGAYPARVWSRYHCRSTSSGIRRPSRASRDTLIGDHVFSQRCVIACEFNRSHYPETPPRLDQSYTHARHRPFDLEVTPKQVNGHATIGLAVENGCHRGGTGPRTAGQRFSGAALPRALADLPLIEPFDPFYIRALRKLWMVFQQGP